MVETMESGIGVQPLFGRPRQSLDDEPEIVIVAAGLPRECQHDPFVVDFRMLEQGNRL
jgi:hypothetical protein